MPSKPLLGGIALIGGWGWTGNDQYEYTGDGGIYQVPQKSYQYLDSLSWTRGRHVFKFGANLINRHVDFVQGNDAKGFVAYTCENDPDLWRNDLPRLDSTGNKYSRGHALLIGGYPLTGAARMAARAAARAGAGLTSIAVPEAGFPIYAAALSSIMVRSLAKPGDLERLLEDSRFSAFLIGPGAGVEASTRDSALALLRTGRPVLLDADAISVFAADPGALWAAVRGPCVITPHEGEFARIFELRGDKLRRARAASILSGAVIVLKGADTVIAAPNGRCIINSNASANLATAGSGDVLGGFILGLLAQGMDAFLAAAAAVWLHGAAGSSFGPGLLAEDLPDLLPAVLRRLFPVSSMNAWFPRLTMHSLVIVISVLTYVLTTRIGEERRPPSIAIAWVLGLIAIPYLALPTYLLFGRRKLQRKPCPSGIRAHSKHWAEELIESFGLPAAAPSRVRLHTDAGESSSALFEIMASAERQLDICTYILGNDEFGRRAVDRMIESARRGVRVRLLIDGVWRNPGTPGMLQATARGRRRNRDFQPPASRAGRRSAQFARSSQIGGRGRRVALGRRPQSGRRVFHRPQRALPWRDLSFDLKAGRRALRRRAIRDRLDCLRRRPRRAGGSPRSRLQAGRTQFLPSGPDQSEDTVHALLIDACFRVDTACWR